MNLNNFLYFHKRKLKFYKSMRIFLLLFTLTFIATPFFAQKTGTDNSNRKGHYNLSKFKQLTDELPTPNNEHTASGAPGYEYSQQQVDYKMDIVLDENKQKLFGEQTITYHNNSKNKLEYLWLQLDQNVRASDSKSRDMTVGKARMMYSPEDFEQQFMSKPFDGGFNIEFVKDKNSKPLDYTINRTMMRINLPLPLASGEKFVFSIKWWYNINNYLVNRGRSGYEPFPDGNNIYVIAQFFPRLAVYNNVEGWQNLQFWGRNEFALEFGNYEVSITTPKDHILNGTGVIQNAKEVFTKKQYNRYINAKTSFEKPVFIVTADEAKTAEKGRAKNTKTWKLYAENVRDFAFTSSRKHIWDAMAVNLNEKTVMAYSLYPNEGNPLWEDHSTKVVANTLKMYSKFTFDYPYPHATSVNAKWQGMEYPMICWNYGRPTPSGHISKRTKKGMIGVVTHEIGHNYFPMIVNSDERQWTWMDEGINSFVQIYALYKYDSILFPKNVGPKEISKYMAGDQGELSPIMANGNDLYDFHKNAYKKPAVGLFILRETVMGHDLFDFAFKTYSNRWKFKHPTPSDFFRTMEDASAMDLDWFWRGWFYTTGNNDIGIKNVKKYTFSDKLDKQNGEKSKGSVNSIYLVENMNNGLSEKAKDPLAIEVLNDYVNENYSEDERRGLKKPKYIYEITFEKFGDLVMPLIVEFEFKDGSKQRKQFPAQIWRKNYKEVSRIFPTEKPIKNIIIDPEEQTADVNTQNNSWPNKAENKFNSFKQKIKD